VETMACCNNAEVEPCNKAEADGSEEDGKIFATDLCDERCLSAFSSGLQHHLFAFCGQFGLHGSNWPILEEAGYACARKRSFAITTSASAQNSTPAPWQRLRLVYEIARDRTLVSCAPISCAVSGQVLLQHPATLAMAATKKGGAGRKRKLEDVAEEPPAKVAKEEVPEDEAKAAEDAKAEEEDTFNRVELVRIPRLLHSQRQTDCYKPSVYFCRWKVPSM
jgi:hypothetical protein